VCGQEAGIFRSRHHLAQREFHPIPRFVSQKFDTQGARLVNAPPGIATSALATILSLSACQASLLLLPRVKAQDMPRPMPASLSIFGISASKIGLFGRRGVIGFTL
jgi:hypothetical protein